MVRLRPQKSAAFSPQKKIQKIHIYTLPLQQVLYGCRKQKPSRCIKYLGGFDF